MAKQRIVVHLVNGSSVAGQAAEAEPEAIEEFKTFLGSLMESSGGWQINIESENGSWGCFPKQSVLWVELEVMGAKAAAWENI